MRTTRSLFLTVGSGGSWGWQSFVTVQGCAHALPTTDAGVGVQVWTPLAKDALGHCARSGRWVQPVLFLVLINSKDPV